MSEELLGMASVSRSGSAHLALPADVDRALGEPDDVVFFVDRSSGEVIVLPDSEVAPR